jgi:transmembrane sensor
MSKLTGFPDLAAAREQAADWISRIGRGLDAEEQAQFLRWRSSPANARALEQLSALWREMDVLKELANVIPEPPLPRRAPRRAWHPLRAAVFAAFVLAMVGVGYLAHRLITARDAPALASRPPAMDFATAVGEQREVPLADGSLLAINTGSLVQVVALSRESRELRLVRGEAHFTVAHDPQRPFRVNAGGHVVQALGTAFDVQLLDAGGLRVIVTDGHVKLLSGSGTVGDLKRGQAMRLNADGSAEISQLSDDAMASRLAWRTGMLMFEGQTLAEVLAEFSRYTETRLVIADDRLRDLRIGGYFAAGDTAALREALRANFGIQSTVDADGVIQIGARRSVRGGQ